MPVLVILPPGLQEKVLQVVHVGAAPTSTVSPMHIVSSTPASMAGRTRTVTITESELTQLLLSAPVTTYSVVEVGVAIGLSNTLLSRVDEGVHDTELQVAQVVLPPKVAVLPRHTFVSIPALTVGSDNTIIVTESLLQQLLASVPVTIYVVVEVGVAMGFEINALSNPATGSQPNDVQEEQVGLPPIAEELPEHKESSTPAVTVGKRFTVTAIESTPEHPAVSVTVTV